MTHTANNGSHAHRQRLEPKLVRLIAGLRHHQVVEAVSELLDYIDARTEACDQERHQNESRQTVSKILKSVASYHLALDRRQHGGAACSTLAGEIEAILSAPWVPGQELTRYEKGSS